MPPASHSATSAASRLEVPSFEALYQEHFDYVWSAVCAMGVAPPEVEDAIQNIFVVVYRRLPRWRGEARLQTWLFAIAIRVVARQRRDAARARRRHDALARVEPVYQDLEEEAAYRQAARRLACFEAELPEEQREVLRLWAYGGHSPKAIGERLGIPRNTVYSRLRVVREGLDKLAARWRKAEHRAQRRQGAKDRVLAAVFLRVPGPAAPWTLLGKGLVGQLKLAAAAVAVGGSVVVVGLGVGTASEGPESPVSVRASGEASAPVEAVAVAAA
ncbi:MAG: sigma-70 family RNA polymerase sigma factor, partial [Nannocystaceae bacterium]|nr:sigma-70 family RNA polymerase sigma factor [Nannocystaceae bacterium]